MHSLRHWEFFHFRADRWASSVANFGMLMRNSKYSGDSSLDQIRVRARNAIGSDGEGTRSELLTLIDRYAKLSNGR